MENANKQMLPKNQNTRPNDSEKVTCFVSKKKVDRASAKQIRHPTEGMVWVAERYIK